MSLARLRLPFLISVGLAALAYLAVVVYADAGELVAAFASFPWWLLAPIVALTLLNYLLRYVKWQFYMPVVGAGHIPRRDAFLLFFAGFALSMTPAKAGEWIKCALLAERAGISFSRAAPLIVAERLSDGIGLLGLIVIGVLAFGVGLEFVIAGAVVMGSVLAAVLFRPLALGVLRILGRVPLLGRRAGGLRELYESSYALFRPAVMLPAIVIGLIAWLAQSVALWLTFAGFGLDATLTLLVQSVLIMSVQMVAGSLLLVPGGAGVSEASIVGLAQLLLGVGRDVASASALLTRGCTLWLSVILGVACLLVYLRLHPRPRLEAGAPVPTGPTASGP